MLDDDALFAACAADIAAGRALGWCQGAAEFGPRALGNRSIIADARSMQTQSTLNLKVKFRESFRPFAPAVLREDTADWFDLAVDSPYMLLVAQVAQKQRIAPDAAADALEGIAKLKVARSTVPAITHVDGSARVQTVDRETNPRFHRLISEFKALTGCPVVVNTSFNVRGEPPVLTPEDAFRCFMGTDIDILVFGNCHLRKHAQDARLARDRRADSRRIDGRRSDTDHGRGARHPAGRAHHAWLLCVIMALVVAEVAARVFFPVPDVRNFNRIAYSPLEVSAGLRERPDMGHTAYWYASAPDHARSVHHLNLTDSATATGTWPPSMAGACCSSATASSRVHGRGRRGNTARVRALGARGRRRRRGLQPGHRRRRTAGVRERHPGRGPGPAP